MPSVYPPSEAASSTLLPREMPISHAKAEMQDVPERKGGIWSLFRRGMSIFETWDCSVQIIAGCADWQRLRVQLSCLKGYAGKLF